MSYEFGCVLGAGAAIRDSIPARRYPDSVLRPAPLVADLDGYVPSYSGAL